MSYLDLLSSLHKSTKRDYLGRVNDPDYPKALAALKAKKWGYEYWDGDRRINYGGYHYLPGRWTKVAQALIDQYDLKSGDKVLDVGCGKGFLLFELQQLIPDLEISGLDISDYALLHAKSEIKHCLHHGNAARLPWADKHFDLVFSLNTLHNLHCYELDQALKEMERVGKQKYLCVESYRDEVEKTNLLYWQVTCEAFNTPEEWDWWFRQTGYTGDHSFIYFE